jgi:2-methylisocitrate lyase-like PEP mutase family enzyme
MPGVSLPARELQDLGVARVSTGLLTQRVALTAPWTEPGGLRRSTPSSGHPA